MNLVKEITAGHDEWTNLRRDIHRHPELGYQEERTADIVARELEACGIETHRGLATTGVVGTLRNGRGNRAIGLRADMDALAMQELNGFDHASVHEGRMHGCGHDGHTVMLLAAARHLAANPDFDGTVHFIFQPAEELLNGGASMVEDGLFDLFPVDTVWGMHNFPGIPVGQFVTRPGPMLACSDNVEVTVNGVGGHGAMPHLARSPVNAACAMIAGIQDLLAQELDAQVPTTFTVGRIHGGDAINVIPDSVEFAGTMRAFSERARDLFEPAVKRMVEGISAAHGISARCRYTRNCPPLINAQDETLLAARAAARIVGEENVNANGPRIMGSEDFSYMLRKRPGNYIMLGNGKGEQGGCMVHNPRYDFNDDILPIGASYWVELTRLLLPRNTGS